METPNPGLIQVPLPGTGRFSSHFVMAAMAVFQSHLAALVLYINEGQIAGNMQLAGFRPFGA